MDDKQVLWRFSFSTVLGQMVAVADEKNLFLLEFADRRHFQRQLARVSQERTLLEGCTSPIDCVQEELHLYFQSKLQKFNTSIFAVGSVFQKKIWEELKNIGYGQTCSYAELAQAINNPRAVRAVAQAVGANPFAVLVPCHRVICHNGDLGGYAGGIQRKERLLDLEKVERLLQ